MAKAKPLARPGKAPCGTCPYRRDVPSGVWAAHEYDKLPTYDGEIFEQTLKGAMARFDCHQNDGKLCAGWVGCHGAANLLALKLLAVQGRVHPDTWEYVSPVPLFGSGAAAAAHGKAEITAPSLQARIAVDKLRKKRGL